MTNGGGRRKGHMKRWASRLLSRETEAIGVRDVIDVKVEVRLSSSCSPKSEKQLIRTMELEADFPV